MKIMKNIISLVAILFIGNASAQIPLLNSNPSATQKVIYLDFDGQVVTGTPWNTQFNIATINAAAAALNSVAITQIWNRVSEDYRPFDVNVTTDLAMFNNAIPTRRIRVVLTPTSSWFPSVAGGVAWTNSFIWGGNPDSPCWVFTNALSNNPKNCAEAASHEVGHTLGLYHQSVWNTSCVKTAEYNPGNGSGVVSWAPIMGTGYTKNVTIWHNGTNSQGCTNTQFDHGSNYITSFNKLSYRIDDVGDNFSSGKQINLNTPLVLDSGIISSNTDVDVYKFDLCNSRYITIDVKPWALDTINYNGANLDIKLVLVNASTSATIATDAQASRLLARIGTTLNAGNYYLVIDGDGSPNYSDYGSMGKYRIRITSNNVPSITSNFTSVSPFCTGQAIAFNDASSGNPAAWQWTITGAVPATSTLQNVSAIYNTSGIYTVQLSATNGPATSCAVSKTIQVIATPTISILGNNGVLCSGGSLTLNASGATSYTWMPGNLSGGNQVLSPSSTQVYTITGSNANCLSSSVTTVTVSPSPTLSISLSSNTLCTGQSATVVASGASSYTWLPGNLIGANQILSPTSTQAYTITGSNVNCTSTLIENLTVLVCTGINEKSKNDLLINAFPNPFKDELIIEVNEPSQITITNALGQVVKTVDVNGKTIIETNDLPKALYILSIKTQNGSRNIKLVKE